MAMEYGYGFVHFNSYLSTAVVTESSDQLRAQAIQSMGQSSSRAKSRSIRQDSLPFMEPEDSYIVHTSRHWNIC
jgi:hypothetical protein